MLSTMFFVETYKCQLVRDVVPLNAIPVVANHSMSSCMLPILPYRVNGLCIYVDQEPATIFEAKCANFMFIRSCAYHRNVCGYRCRGILKIVHFLFMVKFDIKIGFTESFPIRK